MIEPTSAKAADPGDPGALAAGEIALTFDDAPAPDGRRFTGVERTDRILAALAGEQAREAVFFCNTARYEEDAGRQRAGAYARAGHLIGNHAHHHRDLNVVGPDAFIEEIREDDAIVRQSPGFVPLFRYPYSHEGATPAAQQAVRKALDGLGYGLGYFTVDAADWYVEERLQSALEQGKEVNYDALRDAYLSATWHAIEFYDDLARAVLHRSPKHVLILHETDVNALFLGDLIRSIKSRGWKIIPAREAFADPLARQIPHNLFTQFRLKGLALERGYGGAVDNPWATPPKLDALLASSFPSR
jgi:peptidoglycan-N-acetylglucosamine deacetylase